MRRYIVLRVVAWREDRLSATSRLLCCYSVNGSEQHQNKRKVGFGGQMICFLLFPPSARIQFEVSVNVVLLSGSSLFG